MSFASFRLQVPHISQADSGDGQLRGCARRKAHDDSIGHLSPQSFAGHFQVRFALSTGKPRRVYVKFILPSRPAIKTRIACVVENGAQSPNQHRNDDTGESSSRRESLTLQPPETMAAPESPSTAKKSQDDDSSLRGARMPNYVPPRPTPVRARKRTLWRIRGVEKRRKSHSDRPK